MTEGHFRREFAVGADARLVLDHGDGSVSISPWERDVIGVEIDYRAEVVRGGPCEFQVDVGEGANEVRLAGRCVRLSAEPFALRELENRYTIRAPSRVALDLRGEDGDIQIQSWRAGIAIRTQDGDVELEAVEAPSVTIRMQDGDLRARGVRARAIEVEAEDGDLDLELLRQEGLDCTIRGEDGAVRVAVEAGSSVRFAIATGDGSVTVDHPEARDVARTRHGASGTIGAGGGKLTIETADGPVLLTQLAGTR